MKDRCNQESHRDWKNYGGRGITYDTRWGVYELFVEDMGVRPVGTTLERNDQAGNYCKDNCRWATSTEQANNRRVRSNHPSNQSGILGVRWLQRNGKWQVDYKNKYLGLYATLLDAAAARKSAELK